MPKPTLLAVAQLRPASLGWLTRMHRGLFTMRSIVSALDDESVLEGIREDTHLPEAWGLALNERVVEYPWLFAQDLEGRVLDAGSTLNHAPLLDRLLPRIEDLHIVTLAPERRSYPQRGVSYLYGDLRALPYRDEMFDRVVSLSTLEHVGMDNSAYAAGSARSVTPEVDVARAVDELLRVLKPGGRLLVTVPYGRPDDHGWLRVFGRADVDRLLGHSELSKVMVFQYGSDGWFVSSLDAAAASVYRDRATEPAPADLASNARAVACMVLTR